MGGRCSPGTEARTEDGRPKLKRKGPAQDERAPREARSVHLSIRKAKTDERKGERKAFLSTGPRAPCMCNKLFALLSWADFLVPSLRCTLEVSLPSSHPDHISAGYMTPEARTETEPGSM